MLYYWNQRCSIFYENTLLRQFSYLQSLMSFYKLSSLRDGRLACMSTQLTEHKTTSL